MLAYWVRTQVGVLILEFNVVFRRTSVGVWHSTYPIDKVTVEKRPKKYTTGCAHVGGGVINGGCPFFRVIR